jgi:nitrogen regulatory protein P-II 1
LVTPSPSRATAAGWLAKLGAPDLAGGTVVHINATAAALVATLMLGQRRDYGRQALLPHNVPLVLLGAGLLWVGWFGFNAGSALGANASAALAFVNTLLAPMATLAVWMVLDHRRSGRITAIVRPDRLSDVLEALFKAEVRGMTPSRVQGHGGEVEKVQTYRGATVKMDLEEKVRLDIAVSDHFVDPTIEAIATAARTGEVGDGKIFVVPVERVVRIRTGEIDTAAVTPQPAR